MATTFEAVWKQMSNQQRHAFHMKVWAALGGQENGAANMDLLMAGQLRLRVEEVVEIFFDGTLGRRIPPLGMKGVMDAHSDFRLAQPTIVYAERLARITRHLAAGREFISATEFEARCRVVLETLGGNKQTAKLRKCPYFPFALPRLQIADHGTTLDEQILPAGAIDISAVQIMYPDVVAASYNTPGLDCAALQWQGYSLYFRADDDELGFSDRNLRASDGCAGGLVVLG